MGNSLIGKLAQWGWALEATTVGLELEPTAGIPNFNKASIEYGQEWIEETKATGVTVPHTFEVTKGALNPSWTPEMSLTIPLFGQLMCHLCHNCVESGAGPYLQTIIPPIANGKEVTYGATRTGNQVYSSTVKQKLTQTAPRDIAGLGGIINRIDVTIPEFGYVKVTPHFLFFDLITGDTAAGSYTLPLSSTEKLASDFSYKIGNTPAVLYSKEVQFSMIADVIVKRYGGVGATTDPGILPSRFVYNGWSLEGSISKPVVAATNLVAKDYLISGGGVGSDQLMYIYSRTCADYNSVLANLECRFTFNIKVDSATLGYDDETVENIAFKGVYDATNNIFMYQQATTATQAAWATQS